MAILDFSKVTNWHDPEAFDKAQGNVFNFVPKEGEDYGMYEKLVELILLSAWGLDPDGVCSPSAQTIMDSARIKSKTTVFKAIKRIEATGRWQVIRTEGQANIYVPQFIE